MRRRRNHSDDLGVSLFPFLAVLLCTMGALIVLLLVITDRARNTTDEPPAAAATVAAPPNAEDDPNTWRQRAEQLAGTREQVQKIVQDRRTRLGLLERAQRELENKLAELKARLDEQQRLSQADADEVAKTETELARLESRAAEAERNLEEIRQENTNRPASYSVVPYDGPNSTPRRPVYIECRSDRVILQPEGIELGKEDFLFAADAGNPLATVLRATREYLVTSRSLKDEEEPYPLIIVRPDGVEAYYAVRQSLQGWTSDFGYELVNEDWKLTFGPADPNLAIEQNRALAEARVRQAGLVAMLDRRPKKNPTYRPAPRGGIVREGDDTGFGTPSIPYRGEGAGKPGGGGDGSNNGAFADGAGGEGGAGGDRGPGGSAGRRDATGDGYGQGSSGREGGNYAGEPGGQGAIGGAATNGGVHPGAGAGTRGAFNEASGGGGTFAGGDRSGVSGDRRGAGADGSPHDGGDGTRPLDGRGAPGPSGEIRGSAGGPRDPRITAGGNSAYPDGPSRPPGSPLSGNDTGGANGNGNGSGDGGGSGGGGGASGGGGNSSGGSQFSSGAPDPSQRQDSATLASESLARRRGRDWGLRYAAPTATPVTRPLRITCYGDRAIVQSDDPRREPKQIVFKPQTDDSADEFVAAVWAEIKAWGIAGKGMYWRPILSFDVHGGGDRRYEDLRKLLDGSGFEVRRKPTTVADQRPVGTPTSVRPPRLR